MDDSSESGEHLYPPNQVLTKMEFVLWSHGPHKLWDVWTKTAFSHRAHLCVRVSDHQNFSRLALVKVLKNS